MRSRWLRHPGWMWRLSRYYARRWAVRTFWFRPQQFYAYHRKYRHKPENVRIIQSVYWPHVRTLRTYRSPLADLLPFEKRTL